MAEVQIREMLEEKSQAQQAAKRTKKDEVEITSSADPLQVAPIIIPRTLSPEQMEICRAAKTSCHIVMEASSGAGKTEILLNLCQESPDKIFVLMTFSKKLQCEVKSRADTLGVSNVQISTYHAFAGHVYHQPVQDDISFCNVLATGLPESVPCMDTLLLDEIQDMTVEYCAFIIMLLKCRPRTQLILVGDTLQAINQYRGASPLFLNKAESIFGPYCAPEPFRHFRLNTSFRLTSEIADFVNHMILRNENSFVVGLNSLPQKRKPEYISCAGFPSRTLLDVLIRSVAEVGAGEVFILAASVKGARSPIGQMVRLCPPDIPLYWENGTQSMDNAIYRDKVCITSMHSSKGRQRKIVIILNFDETYFAYCRDWTDPCHVPPVLFVGASRASEHLIVIAKDDRTLRTIDSKLLPTFANVTGSVCAGGVWEPPARPERKRTIPVAAYVRDFPPSISVQLLGHTSSTEVDLVYSENGYCAPSLVACVAFPTGVEYVQDFLESAVLIMFEVATCGQTSFGQNIVFPWKKYARGTRPADPIALPSVGEQFKYPAAFWHILHSCTDISDRDKTPVMWVALAVVVAAFADGNYHIARQIENYDWVDANSIQHMVDQLAQIFSEEHPIFGTQFMLESFNPNVCTSWKPTFVTCDPDNTCDTTHVVCHLAPLSSSQRIEFAYVLHALPTVSRIKYIDLSNFTCVTYSRASTMSPEEAKSISMGLALSMTDSPDNEVDLAGQIEKILKASNSAI